MKGQKETTKAKILRTAEQLFIQQGFHGVKTHTIAEKANINHSLIFHYFQNKQNLWQAVKQSVSTQKPSAFPIERAEQRTLEDYLEHFVDRYLKIYQSNTKLMRLLMWQQLEFTQGANLMQKGMGQALSRIEKDLQFYQNQGHIQNKANIQSLSLLIFMVIKSYADTIPPLLTEKKYKEFKSFMVDSLLKVLKTA